MDDDIINFNKWEISMSNCMTHTSKEKLTTAKINYLWLYDTTDWPIHIEYILSILTLPSLSFTITIDKEQYVTVHALSYYIEGSLDVSLCHS